MRLSSNHIPSDTYKNYDRYPMARLLTPEIHMIFFGRYNVGSMIIHYRLEYGKQM